MVHPDPGTERLTIFDVDAFPILCHWYLAHRHDK
jgi:hypothetical protein